MCRTDVAYGACVGHSRPRPTTVPPYPSAVLTSACVSRMDVGLVWAWGTEGVYGPTGVRGTEGGYGSRGGVVLMGGIGLRGALY